MSISRQTEVQALSGPMLDEAIGRMANAGLKSHEIAQALILTGAGLLAGSLGPHGAGHDLRAVATQVSEWITEVAKGIEARSN